MRPARRQEDPSRSGWLADRCEFLRPPLYQDAMSPSENIGTRSGVIGIVDLDASDLTASTIRHTADSLRTLAKRVPRTMIVARVSDWPSLPPSHVFKGLRLLPIHAVLGGDGPSSLTTLEECMTDPDYVEPGLFRWLRRHLARRDLNPQVVTSIVRAGFASNPRDRLPDWIDPPRMRNQLGRVSPSAWYWLGKGIRTALALQKNPDNSVAYIAYTVLGFHDGASLSRHLTRVFGVRPSFVRPRLGWYWLLDDWVRGQNHLFLTPGASRVSSIGEAVGD